MPNTLAHFGVQALGTHAAVRRADPRWVLFAAVLPDAPWIAYRLLRRATPPLDPYDLRVAIIVWSSLFACLLIGGAIALLARRPRRVFAILALGAILHLLLDAAQTKWGNGVHLLAPFSWETLNLGWFWPESGITATLTIVGVGYAFLIWRRRGDLRPVRTLFSGRYAAPAAGFVLLYLLLPLGFAAPAHDADPHYVRTLGEEARRNGRYIELDRVPLFRAGEALALRTFAGEELGLVGPASAGTTVSLRGHFTHPDTIVVEAVHSHAAVARDLASYAGLLFFALLLLASLGRTRLRPGSAAPRRQGSRPRPERVGSPPG